MYQRMRLERLGNNSKKLAPLCQTAVPDVASTKKLSANDTRFRLYRAIKDNQISVFPDILQQKKLDLCHETFQWIFCLSAKYGRVQFAQAAINFGVGVDEQDCNGNTGVLLASQHGHENMVNYLIQSNCDPNLCNNIQRQPLHLACEYGHSKCVEILLSVIKEVNAVDGTKEPPIILASRHGHTDVVKVLIEAKCDIEKPSDCDSLRRRALHYATCFSHFETIEVLLHAGASPDVSDEAGNTPLLIATGSGCYTSVSHLLRYEVDTNHKNSSGMSSVIIACINGETDILKALLENGADPNVVDHMGDPAVLVAARNERTHCAFVLIKAGCDLNAYNPKHGRTALWWAVENRIAGLVKYMIANGADIDAGITGTPLESAARNDYSGTVDLLLHKGVDVNKRIEPEGATALLYALDYSHNDIAKKLLNAGADPNMMTIYGVSSLMVGREKPSKDDNITDHLIEKGVDLRTNPLSGYTCIYPRAMKAVLYAGGNPNSTTKAGDTPLIKAAVYNRLKVAELLIRSNCDVDRKGRCYTACQMALLKPKSFRIAQMLIAVGCDLKFVFQWQKTCFPEHLEQKPKRIDWLLKKASEPKKLAQMCRKTVLNAIGLGTCTPKKISTLPLPPSLIRYLKYSEFRKKCFDDYDGEDIEDVPQAVLDDDSSSDEDTDDDDPEERGKTSPSSSSESEIWILS